MRPRRTSSCARPHVRAWLRAQAAPPGTSRPSQTRRFRGQQRRGHGGSHLGTDVAEAGGAHAPQRSALQDVSRRAAGAHTALRVQAYPIFVAIGAACVMCVGQCGRQLLASPDVRITKSERALGVLEDKRFTKEGAEFREHSLRRCGPSAPLSCAARGGSRR